MSVYYAYIDDMVLGLFSQKEILQLKSDGKITIATQIEREGGDGWHTFSEFDELMFPPSEPQDVLQGLFEREEDDSIVLRCPVCMQKYKVARMAGAGNRVYCRNCDCLVSVPVPVAIPQGMSASAETPAFAESPNGNAPLPADGLDDGGPVPGDPGATAFEASMLPISEDIGALVCPHCWKHFDVENVLYIAVHPSLVGDPILGEFEPRRFRPNVYNQLGQPLDECGLPSTEMACPHCHLRFPAGMMDSPSLYFSVAGATSSGKSYFITCQTHKLREVLPRFLDASFYDLDPRLNETLSNYEKQLFMPLDASKITALPATQISGEGISDKVRIDEVDVELPKPFIFDFQVNGKPESRRNLVFYDNSGELFIPGRDEWVNQATRHLSHSNGIIFLFDPTNESAMRRSICNPDDPQVSKRPRVVDQTLLLTELISRIRRHSNMTATESCDIPLVVGVCKYDIWRESFPKELGSPYVSDGEECGLDLNKVLDVSFALRNLLMEYVPGLVNSAESFFKHVYFVPVSAFGTLAELDEGGFIGVVTEKIRPIWVEVPFLCIMHENGDLPARRVGASARRGSGAENGQDAPQPAFGFKAKADERQISFRHPVTGENVRLPLNYAGAQLEIDGKLYELPEPPTRRQSASNSVWI